jgi:hypothetical protein
LVTDCCAEREESDEDSDFVLVCRLIRDSK